MPRLAWFAPLPPIRSGVAAYNAELLSALSGRYQIDAFVDGRAEMFRPPHPAIALFSAFDFVWRERAEPYDLVVYQLGNASCHDYMWSYLIRYPGLVVLHDGQLHHARGRMLLQQNREDDYRHEFWYSHPGARKDLAELGTAGLLWSLTYLFPMLRPVVESSRRVLVHNPWLAQQIREAYPDAAVDVVQMGVRPPSPRVDARHRVRARHNIDAGAVVFTAFGKVTPEKRIREALRALPAVADTASEAHLLLAGEMVNYHDIRTDIEAAGLAQMVTVAGYIPDEDVDDYLAASDVCLCTRWPTSRETSASWVRCLAAGKPTIATDLIHTVDTPMLDPRNWSLLSTDTDGQPVGVSIDILDEVHSLKLAFRRLTGDAGLRERLGNTARARWSKHFRLDQMAAGYEEVIARALADDPKPKNRVNFPRHLRSTGIEHADMLMRQIPNGPALMRDSD